MVLGAEDQPDALVAERGEVAERLGGRGQVVGERGEDRVLQFGKDFLWPLLVEYGYTPTRETLNVGIWQAYQGTPQNLLIAASAMAASPTIVCFLIFQRNIMAGLTAGGIRG